MIYGGLVGAAFLSINGDMDKEINKKKGRKRQ